MNTFKKLPIRGSYDLRSTFQ